MTKSSILLPLETDEWDPQLEFLKDGFAAKLNVYRVMANHPALLEAWFALRQHLVHENELGAQLAEAVILRASHHLGSAYERAHHIVRGRGHGLSDIRISDLLSANQPEYPADAIVARCVDDLMGHKRLTLTSREALVDLVGRKGMLDLVALVGFYSTLGYILNSFETPIDDDIAAELRLSPLSDEKGNAASVSRQAASIKI